MYKLEAELAPLLQDMRDFNVQKWDFTVKFDVDESRRNRGSGVKREPSARTRVFACSKYESGINGSKGSQMGECGRGLGF